MASSTHRTERHRAARIRVSHRFVTAALLAGSLTLGACAIQREVSLPPPAPVNSFISELARRDRTLESMQTPAVMEYSSASDHFKAREEITVRRPASLRVEAMSPLGVALVVAADGTQLAVFDPSKDTLMRGPATAPTLARFVQIPMAPEAAVRLLLALAPDPDLLNAPPASASSEGEVNLFSYRRADGAIDELGFKDGRLVLARERSAGGAINYEVRYSDYRDIGAMPFPYQLEADFPVAATSIKLRYARPIIDAALTDSLFTLSPGPSTRQINLGDVAAPTAAPRG